MDKRSSTSSSRRVALTGALVAVAVFAVDAALFGANGPWPLFVRHLDDRSDRVERRIAEGQLELRRLRADPRSERVFVVGSSRTEEAFAPNSAEPSPFAFCEWVRPGVQPFEIRSAVEPMLREDPFAVVWLLSEFDTHRPLRLRPQLAFGSFSAIADLIAEAGTGFAIEHRVDLYRLLLGSGLAGYRYRTVAQRAGLDELRRFAAPGGTAEPAARGARAAMAGSAAIPITRRSLERRRAEVAARLGRPLTPSERAEVEQVLAISRGRHAAVQMGLLRRAAARLKSAGVAVVLVEAPLNPAAAVLFDPGIRDDFLAFAESLANADGVRFVPLERSGPFGADDFSDLTHVNASGARRLTGAVLASLDALSQGRETGRAASAD